MPEHKLIADLPADLRPYEKCEACGVEALTDAELLAVILKSGSRERSAVLLAEEILYSEDSTDGLLRLMHWSQEDYKAIKGVGRVKALQLLCVAEISRRISRRRAEEHLKLNDPASVAGYYMEHLRHANEEEVHLMLLDSRNRFIRSVMVSRGTVNRSAVSSREIFTAALKNRAAAFIMIHNHPSGRPTPSNEDIVMTFNLMRCGRMMNIPIRDSIIIGDNCFISFVDSGIMEQLDGVPEETDVADFKFIYETPDGVMAEETGIAY